MKLYKDEYVIEGTVKEITEFLKEDLNKNKQYIKLTESTALFYKNPIEIAGGFREFYYIAPKGTELNYLGKEVVRISGFDRLCSVYVNEKGLEIVIPEA